MMSVKFGDGRRAGMQERLTRQHGVALAQPRHEIAARRDDPGHHNAIDVAVAHVARRVKRKSQAGRSSQFDQRNSFGEYIGHAIGVDQARHNVFLQFPAPFHSPAAFGRSGIFRLRGRRNPSLFRNMVTGASRLAGAAFLGA